MNVSSISIRMARVTGCAEIYVPWHTLMMPICFLLIIMRMTEDAFKYLVVGRIYMAVGANVPFIVMSTRINRKILSVMIPVRLGPHNCVMAGFTIRRKSCRQMIRIRGIVILLLMETEFGYGQKLPATRHWYYGIRYSHG
jgi:hypothetical protein